MPGDLGSLRIDALRLEQSLVRYARIGATAGGGVTRLALSVEDRDARDALASDLAAIGCQVTVDDLGNMTGTRAGSEDCLAVRMAHTSTPSCGADDSMVRLECLPGWRCFGPCMRRG